MGWESFIDVRGSHASSLAAEVTAGWGALARLRDRDELADHVVTAFDLAYKGSFATSAAPSGERPQALVVPLALELREALGSHRSWCAARLSESPGVVLAGAPRRMAFEAEGEAEAHLALRSPATAGAHDPALLLRAHILRTTLSVAGRRADTEALVSAGVELR